MCAGQGASNETPGPSLRHGSRRPCRGSRSGRAPSARDRPPLTTAPPGRRRRLRTSGSRSRGSSFAGPSASPIETLVCARERKPETARSARLRQISVAAQSRPRHRRRSRTESLAHVASARVLRCSMRRAECDASAPADPGVAVVDLAGDRPTRGRAGRAAADLPSRAIGFADHRGTPVPRARSSAAATMPVGTDGRTISSSAMRADIELARHPRACRAIWPPSSAAIARGWLKSWGIRLV
jgi:hypothetical protein